MIYALSLPALPCYVGLVTGAINWQAPLIWITFAVHLVLTDLAFVRANNRRTAELIAAERAKVEAEHEALKAQALAILRRDE